MYNTLEIEIKKQLRQHRHKAEIFKNLKTEDNRHELAHMLNNLPDFRRNRQVLALRLILFILLLLLTTKQILFIYLHETSSIDLMLGLVGPLIHVYIMRELIRNHRLAYQILPFISFLALFRPECRISPDVYMYISMAVLSGLLYFYLFPVKERIEE